MFAVKSQPEEVFGLPNIKSAKKRVQLAEVRNARNKADKSALKTALKKFEAAAAERCSQEERYDHQAQQHWLIEPNSERRPRGRLFFLCQSKDCFWSRLFTICSHGFQVLAINRWYLNTCKGVT